MPALRDRFLIYAAAFLRSLAIGMCGVLLALHLHSLGWDERQAGLLGTFGLAGIATATLLTSFIAGRARRTLLVLGLLNVLGGLVLVFSPAIGRHHVMLLVAAFFGMINGLGRDRGPAYALEQALLPATTTPEKRTFAIAWYSLVLDAGLALGSLAAALPFLLRRAWGWELANSYQAVWWLYTAISTLSLILYTNLSPAVEAAPSPNPAPPPGRSSEASSRATIYKLAALTGMDSLGGGFLSSLLLSYWFFKRFGIGEEWLGPLFFAARVANAASHLVAAWLARHIGLLNTMVFTHLPSSLFLIAVPFAPTFPLAVALFLAREGLVEMDVPTRQSYILAVVRPEERAFASGFTTFTRNVAYAVAPALAGAAMKTLSQASPLFFGGGIKIVYDLVLYTAFRRVKPPEEKRERPERKL